jgi:hypothetical protein
MKNITDYCNSSRKQLITGCNSNAQYIIQGGTRGKSLMEYSMSSNLNISKEGNKPTFAISNRKEVVDVMCPHCLITDIPALK